MTTSSSVSLEVLPAGGSTSLGIYSDWVILEAGGGGGGGAEVGLKTTGGGGGAPEGFTIDATGGFEDEASEVIELLTAEVVDDKVDTGDDDEKD